MDNARSKATRPKDAYWNSPALRANQHRTEFEPNALKYGNHNISLHHGCFTVQRLRSQTDWERVNLSAAQVQHCHAHILKSPKGTVVAGTQSKRRKERKASTLDQYLAAWETVFTRLLAEANSFLLIQLSCLYPQNEAFGFDIRIKTDTQCCFKHLDAKRANARLEGTPQCATHHAGKERRLRAYCALGLVSRQACQPLLNAEP